MAFSFPNLSQDVARDAFDEYHLDNTISDEAEGGYQFTRPRSTRQRMGYNATHELCTQDDREAMEDFVRNYVKGMAISFTWLHPVTTRELNVRFKSLPKYTYRGSNGVETLAGYIEGIYDIAYAVEEV